MSGRKSNEQRDAEKKEELARINKVWDDQRAKVIRDLKTAGIEVKVKEMPNTPGTDPLGGAGVKTTLQ